VRQRLSLVWIVAAIAILTTATSLILRGTYGAVLDSVRFSALVLALALTARPAGSPWHGWQQPLTIGFTAAHYVHFAAVGALVYVSPSHPLHTLPARGLASMFAGFLLITAILVTTLYPRWPRLNAFLIHATGIILIAAFSRSAVTRPLSATMAAVLVAAFAYRIVLGRRSKKLAAAAV
jgi:hypothetical protein